MGHYRGRDNRKRRLARRRKEEAMAQRPIYGLPLLAEAFKVLVCAAELMARAIRDAWASVGEAVSIAMQPLARWLADHPEVMERLSESEPITLDELRRLAGDGAELPGVRFTSEGGFSTN